LVEGSDGALYGVTLFGLNFGNGTLFRVTKDDNTFSVVFDFARSGARGPVGLTFGSDGRFYIAASANEGALLRVNQDGTAATELWYFSSSGGDASYPSTPLLEATNGRLYGAGVGVFSVNEDGSNPAVLQIAANTGLLEGSDGLLYARWSPDGRYIAASGNAEGEKKLSLFDLRIRKWVELARGQLTWPTWSRDGRYVYVRFTVEGESSLARVRISDHALERVASLKDLKQRQSRFLGTWIGLSPDGSPFGIARSL